MTALGRAAAVVVAVAVVAAACTGTPQQPAEDPGRLLPDGVRALAQERGRDTGGPAVALPRLPAGPRTGAASALTDPAHPSLPAPLVDLALVVDGGVPPDGIPALDAPTFQRTGQVRWVDDDEQVLVVEVAGEARAYPVQVLTLHEVVNDTVGGVPVAVTWCPLCASGIAFDRRAAGQVLSFGTSGRLYRSDLVMYDRQTESLWPQIEGRAVAGALTGTALEVLPAQLLSWEQWREAHPQGWVLSRQTGHDLPYGSNPYVGYDDKATLPLAFEIDNRVEWLKQPVVGIEVGEDALAVDVEALRRDRVREVEVGGVALTLWWLPGARSSLDGWAVGEGREVGTVAVFRPEVDGARRTFRADGDGVVDVETGSRWDALGRAVSGPAQGAQLAPQPHVTTFWFAWRGFHEDTRVLR